MAGSGCMVFWLAWCHIGSTFGYLTFVPVLVIVKDEFLCGLTAVLFVTGSLGSRWPKIRKCTEVKQEQFLS
jgi:hypothetical protein